MLGPIEDPIPDNEWVEIESDEEVEAPKRAHNPSQPTLEQIEQHRTDGHQPYRTWCKWCVMGRGRGTQHGRCTENQIPIVGVDYFFITTGGVKKRKELEFEENASGEGGLLTARNAGSITKCILVRDFKSKCIFAHVIPCKGLDEDKYTADLVTNDILWLGYTELMIKADNENALQALVLEVIERIRQRSDGIKINKQEPAKYESQSNGGTEVGVMVVRGLFRTLKLCLESRIETHIQPDHPIIAWLITHTCVLLNARNKGADGMTPWARIRGKAFAQHLLGFGECVLWKFPSKGPAHDPTGNMGAKWDIGEFIGYSRSSNVYIISTDNGIRTARSIARRPILNRWGREKLMNITATPWSIRDKPETTVRMAEPRVNEQPKQNTPPPITREFRINKADLEEHGYTDGCPMCSHFERYGSRKGGERHTGRCRERLITAIATTPEGQRRLTQWSENTDKSIAERIEFDDKTRRAHEDQKQPKPETGNDTIDDKIQDATHTASGSREGWFLPADDASHGETRGPRGPSGSEALGEEPPHTDDTKENNDGDNTVAEDIDMGYMGNLEPAADDEIAETLLAQLGGTKSYQRETRRAFKRIVTEIYSPPRITKEIKEQRHRHLMPGFAFDLTTRDPDDDLAWGFSCKSKRDKARRLIRQQKPYVLIGSPMCTAFSTWQHLNKHKAKTQEQKQAIEKALTQATVHMNFVAALYTEQLQEGRYFLHEHPRWATSWQLKCMQELNKIPTVKMTHADQCQYGAEVKRGSMEGSPVMKPTGFMSNSEKILEALSKRCLGKAGKCSRAQGGTHAHAMGHIAKDAAVYPKELCRAVLKGVTAQARSDRRLKPGCVGLQPLDDEEEIHALLHGPDQGYSGKYKDDLTQQVLRDDLVHAARQKELRYFNSKGVWVKVPRDKSRRTTGKSPITVRWVDVNKGDEMEPNYRSRLVARQLKAHDRSGTSYFAPAPPLEALRTVLSLAMTKVGDHSPDWEPSSENRTQLSFIDVSRAYFNAKIDKEAQSTFVDLPPEDPDHADMCGELLRHMYGTRMAADGWQEEYSTMLIRAGFRQGVACPNVFYHKDKKIVTSVHGDDFTSSGPKPSLDWLEEFISNEYEITIGPRLGPGRGDAKETRALNRIIRWTEEGIEYEADPRQAERLISECGLEGAKTVVTPGVKLPFKELEADPGLPKEHHSAFRGAAARGNYLAADRIDVQFPCKEVCRWMAKPTVHAWQALKRLCRFLTGLPRLVYQYRRQTVECVDVYTDTDWAGCALTRKSTSGGCVLFGSHTIKHWSSTQPSIALSSGEAEFNGVIRGAGQGLGYQALLKDLGVSVPVRVWTDSSAAIGICSRQGLGKLRHLDTHTLWIQQAVRNKRIELKKVPGEANPADLLTKHSNTYEKMRMLVDLYSCYYREGRAESAPNVRKGASDKKTMADTGLAMANGDDNDDVRDDDTQQNSTPTIMPHLEYERSELDVKYPGIAIDHEEIAPEHEDEDALLRYGFKLAEKIEENMLAHGRTRREHEKCDDVSSRVTEPISEKEEQGEEEGDWQCGDVRSSTPSPTPEKEEKRERSRPKVKWADMSD